MCPFSCWPNSFLFPFIIVLWKINWNALSLWTWKVIFRKYKLDVWYSELEVYKCVGWNGCFRNRSLLCLYETYRDIALILLYLKSLLLLQENPSYILFNAWIFFMLFFISSSFAIQFQSTIFNKLIKILLVLLKYIVMTRISPKGTRQSLLFQ